MPSRILYISTFLSAGSNRSYCEDLADHLEAAGARVTRTSRRTGRIARLVDILTTIWRARALYDVAIVDVFSGPAFVWAEAACVVLRRLDRPYVLVLHGGNLPVFAEKWPRRVSALLRSATVVTAPSRFMRERMRVYRSDIVVIPNAVDTAAHPFTRRSLPQPHLVWLRAFHSIYNPILAIDVLASLVGRFADASLTMVGPDKGDGTWTASVSRAEASGLSERVRFVGGVARKEVGAYLANADVFINTTNVDNTPLSILEAASSGLCIVSTAVGGIPYLLEHERNALLVPARDPAAMSAAVTRVLEEPGLADRLSLGARELASTHDWTDVLKRWEHTLSEVSRG